LFGSENAAPYVKDGINDYLVQGPQEAVNPNRTGTKAAAHYGLHIGAGQTAELRLRLTNREFAGKDAPSARSSTDFSRSGNREAGSFYATVIPQKPFRRRAERDAAAFAGMLWSKQYYPLCRRGVAEWATRRIPRRRPNAKATAIMSGGICSSADVISMPDKWEYPWYAAWDLAFHCIRVAGRSDFAKDQLLLICCASGICIAKRADTRLRVGRMAREPSCSRLVGLRVYRIERSGRASVTAVSGARLPQTAAQFHLVGQPQGRGRTQ